MTGEEVRQGVLTDGGVSYAFSRAQARDGVTVGLDQTFVPAATGQGADVRSLAARVAVTCASG